MSIRGTCGMVRLFARTLLLAYLAAACTAYHAKTAPVPETLATPAREARVTLRNGGTFEVRDARVQGDSVVGTVRGQSMRFAVPVSDVQEVEVRETSVSRSLLLGAGIVVGAFAALLALVIATVPPSY